MTTKTEFALTIPESPWRHAIADLVDHSALAYCTTRDGWTVTPNYSPATFSSGEKVLWRLLESLTGGDLHWAFDKLDTGNLRAVARVIASASDTVGAGA